MGCATSTADAATDFRRFLSTAHVADPKVNEEVRSRLLRISGIRDQRQVLRLCRESWSRVITGNSEYLRQRAAKAKPPVLFYEQFFSTLLLASRDTFKLFEAGLHSRPSFLIRMIDSSMAIGSTAPFTRGVPLQLKVLARVHTQVHAVGCVANESSAALMRLFPVDPNTTPCCLTL